ncbi:MAG TPA: exodeoxyribonuclease III [Acidimicrobiales bacterium]|nr:exodeoxyribonuclease III [Acidimicrobiales bacterium]
MRLVSWNVNGIRAVVRKELFAPFVAELQPDVICLQETKAQQSQAELDLTGYDEHWNSAEKKGYSGTAIFTKPAPLVVSHGLPDDIITEHKVIGDSFGDPNIEGRVLTAEYDDFYLVTVYTPNAKEDLGRLALRHEQWDPAFLAYATQLQEQKPVVFCGDLNVAHTPDDLANPKTNVGKKGFTDEERLGFQNFVDAGFVDTFRLFHQGNGYYTWWSNFANSRSRNIGWRIDYFLVSESLSSRVTAADIHPDVMGSDHCPVSITLDV